jgi:protein TonB
MFRPRYSVLYGASLVLHAGVALAVATIKPPPERRKPTTITMREMKHKAPTAEAAPAPPAPAPPKAPTPAAPQPRAAQRPAPHPVSAPAETAAPAPASGAQAQVADFGVALSGGVGAAGIAVPAGVAAGPGPEHKVKAAPPKALTPQPKADDGVCMEALIKPKPINVPQPAYADRAREAGIQGKVRVELTVDDTGQVVSARVIESLGYGLDEAALEAAKASRFEPATRCGKPTSTTFVIGMRFSL